jgi:hypothetical protein
MAADDRAPITPLAIPVTTTFEVNGQAGAVLRPCSQQECSKNFPDFN